MPISTVTDHPPAPGQAVGSNGKAGKGSPEPARPTPSFHLPVPPRWRPGRAGSGAGQPGGELARLQLRLPNWQIEIERQAVRPLQQERQLAHGDETLEVLPHAEGHGHHRRASARARTGGEGPREIMYESSPIQSQRRRARRCCPLPPGGGCGRCCCRPWRVRFQVSTASTVPNRSTSQEGPTAQPSAPFLWGDSAASGRSRMA